MLQWLSGRAALKLGCRGFKPRIRSHQNVSISSLLSITALDQETKPENGYYVWLWLVKCHSFSSASSAPLEPGLESSSLRKDQTSLYQVTSSSSSERTPRCSQASRETQSGSSPGLRQVGRARSTSLAPLSSSWEIFEASFDWYL